MVLLYDLLQLFSPWDARPCGVQEAAYMEKSKQPHAEEEHLREQSALISPCLGSLHVHALPISLPWNACLPCSSQGHAKEC